MAEKYQMYIDGEWCDSSTGEVIEVISPVTGELLGTVPKASQEDVNRAIEAADRVKTEFKFWSDVERGELVCKIADELEKETEKIARDMTMEQGKPYHTESIGEVIESAENLRNAKEDLIRINGEILYSKDPDRKIFTKREPNGVYGAIDPAADYKLAYRCQNGRGVYTFCMCPGGEVVAAASSEGMTVTNGMSYAARDGKYANSALLVDVRTDDFDGDDVLAGVRFQEKYERLAFEFGGGYAPVQTTWGRFREDAVSAAAGNSENLNKVAKCLPDFVTEAYLEAMPALGRKLKGFDCYESGGNKKLFTCKNSAGRQYAVGCQRTLSRR